MIMTKQDDRPAGLTDAQELFAAHLEVLTHLMRDELRWGEGEGNDRGSPIFSLLRRERRRLLDFQGGELEREARFRLARDRRAPLLQRQLGVSPGDALAVAWYFEAELRARRESAADPSPAVFPELQNFVSAVGQAHSHLLNGESSFVPGPEPLPARGLAMAVAIAATRLARSRGEDATWIDVEPLALKILRTLTSPVAGAGGAASLHLSAANAESSLQQSGGVL